MANDRFIFIMAGGSGERFWPLSRKCRPKHLLRLFGERSLLGQTVDRVRPMVPPERLFILTNQGQVAPIREDLPDFPADQIIGEPEKRDTAPAVAIANGIARSLGGEDAVVALLTADHVIKPEPVFRDNLAASMQFASASGALVTFAITPTYPSTGFGYLELGPALPEKSDGFTLRKLLRFVEKPDETRAKEYLASGHYAWNSGMFVWRVSSFLREADLNAPVLAQFVRDFPTLGRDEFIAARFGKLPKISIDYAIMEKASQVAAIETKFQWDDVGSWSALPEHFAPDSAGNTVVGQIAQMDSHGNIVFSKDKTVALCGVTDLVVVTTDDSVLICHRDRVQDIKKLLPQIPDELK
ncbi:sugar phosphate nucleotidyltransferase [Oscillatoria laete-virens NRMC-F 0139]|nr:sugar phosphate nucleotidyltransferase [Oscillatoria laete-virens]MDL5054015.1 sugar phosphate nucleotidyltransferase [Oscillatoria laete-virens NRMC-F 0139]